ncbi:MAG: hypothetical protein ACRDAI_06550 [Candidatus Rhabdochlamydia sp.]
MSNIILPTNAFQSAMPKENQPIKKLTLFKRIAKVFSDLYQKISNLFSRKPLNDDLCKRIDNLNQKIGNLEILTKAQETNIQALKQELDLMGTLRINNNRTNSFPRETIYDIPTNNKPIKPFA